MSEFKRLQRLIKSRIPRFPRRSEHTYSHEDARMMITDLALSLSPEALEKLTNSTIVLEDFLHSIYHLEEKVKKRVVGTDATIKAEFAPQAYEEDGQVGFSIIHKDKEIVFAEYTLEEIKS